MRLCFHRRAEASMEIRLLFKNKPENSIKITKTKALISLISSSDLQLQEYRLIQPTAVFEKELMMSLCEANELAQGQVLSLTLWLARVYMEEYGDDDISLLLTLETKGVSAFHFNDISNMVPAENLVLWKGGSLYWTREVDEDLGSRNVAGLAGRDCAGVGSQRDGPNETAVDPNVPHLKQRERESERKTSRRHKKWSSGDGIRSGTSISAISSGTSRQYVLSLEYKVVSMTNCIFPARTNCFVFVRIQSGFHEIRNSIPDVVAVSRLLNATLVIPEIQSTTSSKGISFIDTLLFHEQLTIVELKTLPTLVLMLQSEDPSVHGEAIGAIGNLVHSSPDIKKEVIRAGGALQPVISLLRYVTGAGWSGLQRQEAY
ncbi:Armadillo-like helical protein [Raphanus sativus]|nr:Armadillo-like helical protein [Raphanus sativus]